MPDQEQKHLSEAEMDRLRTWNLSPELVAVIRRDPKSVGKTRNSARERVRGVLRGNEDVPSSDLRPKLEAGGHYFEALLDGNLGEAFIRADITNTRILLSTFGVLHIEECLIHDEDFSPEKAKRYLSERIQNYGDGLDL